jgi:hypothetical protein
MKGFIGIDPGKNGGIAVKYPDGEVETYKCPETVHDLNALMESISKKSPLDNFVAILEWVHSMPQDSAKSAFSFGRNVGRWQMALAAFGVSYREIRPQEWQKSCENMPSKRKTEKADPYKKRRKDHMKALAQARYPSIKVTNYIADALLIMDYLRSQAWAQ